MIQDIGEHTLDNSYRPEAPAANDYVIAAKRGDVLVDAQTPDAPMPTVSRACEALYCSTDELIYAFSIDEMRFFIAPTWAHRDRLKQAAGNGLEWMSMHAVFDLDAHLFKFAYATGFQLSNWYEANQHCGSCGTPLEHDDVERMLACPSCGRHAYPRINPAVIVAVIDGDRILMTRYANRPYKRRALIAGFCEVGETAEETVAREVFEETGVHVKDIRYVASQPWGLSGDLLLGFTARLDGSDEIHLDTNELKCAEWVPRGEIFEEDDNLSLTRSLVMAFKRGELEF